MASRFVFTWNNYPFCRHIVDEELAPDQRLKYQRAIASVLKRLNYSYIVYGYEVAPTTGTPHLQGYVEFKNKKSISVCTKICNGIWMKAAEGTASECFNYAAKDGEFFEEGDIKKQGQRMDLEEAMLNIREGIDQLDCMEMDPMTYAKYGKFMEKYRILWEKKARKRVPYQKKTVICHVGKTGLGKTRKAIEENPEAFLLSKTITGLWWDGYDGEEVVILDDFRDADIPLNQLLRILDGYYVQVPTKGGSTTLLAKKIYLTSNVPPEEWYKGCDSESRNALFRRIDYIEFFRGKNNDREVPLSNRENGTLPVFASDLQETDEDSDI